jgi:hypothetical protein
MRKLRDLNWLISYEAGLRGWLPSIGRSDHIRATRILMASDLVVSFYDDSMVGRVKITGIAPSIGVAPIFSPL